MPPEPSFAAWADAHVVFNNFAQPHSAVDTNGLREREQLQQQRLLEAPRGHLLVENAFFHSLRHDRKIYLAHTTFNYEKIAEHGLFASSGCLVGSVYCTPLTKFGKTWRMHNLGEYIHTVEARLTDRHERHQTLLIEITQPENTKTTIVGTDYLRLGDIHYSIYKQLEYLLSSKERHTLHDLVIDRLKHATDFLNISQQAFHDSSLFKPRQYLDQFIATVRHLPILGYLYFEVVAEYFMLYQDTPEALAAEARGEFYAPTHKNLMFGLYPDLIDNYSLSRFQPTIRQLESFIVGNKLINDFHTEDFIQRVAERLLFLVNARLLSTSVGVIDWYRQRWEFDDLLSVARPLIGHLIHRELRTFGRYPNFYYYFDQYKALQAWNYWNHSDIAVPFNGVFPKGEVGINPAYPDLKYAVSLARAERRSDGMYLEVERSLDIDIIPKLIDLSFLTLRKKQHRKLKGT